MNAKDMLDLFLANLPTILAVLGGLGLWKVGEALILRFTTAARAKVKETETKLDDDFFVPILDVLDKVAHEVGRGNIQPGLDALRKAKLMASAARLSLPRKR